MAGSPPNLHTMDSRSACIQGVLKVKVKVKVTWYEHFCAGTKMASSRGQMAWSRPNLHMIVTAGSLSLHPGCSQGQGQRSRDTRTFLDSWNELLRHWRPGSTFKLPYLWKGPSCYWPLMGIRLYTRFRLVPKSMTLNNLWAWATFKVIVFDFKFAAKTAKYTAQ